MSLRIAKFDTTCHVPAESRRDAQVVDRLARGRFARDLGEHLGPSLARQPAIIRIRRLEMRVILPASELNEDALSLKWRQEFGRALFTALAYPAGAGPFEVFRAESLAGFVAAAIRDLLDGTAPAKWQYAEFESFFRLGSTQAALNLICEWPQQSLAVLLYLAEQKVLGRLVSRFEDVALERLFAALAPSTEAETKTLSIADLITVAKLVLEHAPDKTAALRSRAYALNLFVEAQRTRQPLPSPRVLFHALLALAVLLNEDLFWPGLQHGQPRSGRLPSNVIAILEGIARELAAALDEESFRPDTANHDRRGERGPSNFAAILDSLGGALLAHMQSFIGSSGREPIHLTGRAKAPDTRKHSARISTQLAELNQLLQVLRGELKVPPPSAKPLEARWISSEWCGLFLLSSTLEKFGWIPAWRRLTHFQAGGVGSLIAGLALSIQERFEPSVPSLDPAIALFAGYLQEPDLLHARRVFQEFPLEARLSVLRAALPREEVDRAAESWAGTFERLAEILLRDFASQIRGFRQATPQGIVRSFIARPGRIRIDPERLVVFLSPSPFNVALHISGMDQPVDSSIVLSGLRIEFELGDL